MKKGISMSCKKVIQYLGGITLLLAASTVSAAPFEITLTMSKAKYLDNEPVKALVRVVNTSGVDLMVQKAFFDQDFHLKLAITMPDGKIVRAKDLPASPEPLSPIQKADANGAFRPAVPCNRIAADDFTQRLSNDLRVYYDLSQTGFHSARVISAVQTFSEYYQDPNTLKYYCFLDAVGNQTFSPLLSNRVGFGIAPSVPVVESGLQGYARLVAIGAGTSPTVEKSPIAGMPVKLIKADMIPVDFQPVNFKTYGQIWDHVPSAAVISARITNKNGRVSFGKVPQDDYVMIGKYTGAPDLRYIGKKIDAADVDWGTGNLVANLVVIENYKKKQSSAKTTKKKGSYLLIIQPEFVEWNDTEEPYPFVFEAEGDWDITTSIAPPEGFVSDTDSLNAEVIDETQVVQFTVTDIGSDWIETDVTFEITHKGKSEIVKEQVGIRIGKELGEKKGLARFGETDTPVFSNGQLVDLIEGKGKSEGKGKGKDELPVLGRPDK